MALELVPNSAGAIFARTSRAPIAIAQTNLSVYVFFQA